MLYSTLMIRVVNRRFCSKGEYIGRPSPLGNPFTHLSNSKHAEIMVATRDEAIDGYEQWLHGKLRDGDHGIAMELRRLKSILDDTGNLTLVCWCKPARCHGDVIKSILEKWDSFRCLYPCLG